MKKILSIVRRPFVWLFVTLIYGFGCLCYDKRYLTGRYFNRWHFSPGWQWILRCWFAQKILGYNRHVPWPVSPNIRVAVPENIIFDPDDMQIFQGVGSYFQGIGARVILGKGCKIASNTGFITANHDFSDISRSQPGREIVLGECCWVAMNAMVLPGVHLGPHTIVGAGAVVTKSFPEGWCVIAGNPAKRIKELLRSENENP